MTDSQTIFEWGACIDIKCLQNGKEEEENKQHVDASNILNKPQFELEDEIDTVEDDESSVDQETEETNK